MQMLHLDRILNQDRLLRAVTGLNRKAFEALLPSFAQAYDRSLFNPLVERQRALGGGRKATLRTMEEKLLYRLLYCKGYPTFALLSVLFNFDRLCAHAWVHRLLPILETTLGEKQVLPVRKLSSLEARLLRGRQNATENAIDLLILSACQTAEGDRRATLGLAGLAVRAGARNTLATLWQVSDASTVALMQGFYKALRQPGMTKAEALRHAQIQLLQNPQYQAPYYWAPYVLVGNWR